MATYNSDQITANGALTSLQGQKVFPGPASSGGHVVDDLMRSIGLERTVMYGGYILGTELGGSREVAGHDRRDDGPTTAPLRPGLDPSAHRPVPAIQPLIIGQVVAAEAGAEHEPVPPDAAVPQVGDGLGELLR